MEFRFVIGAVAVVAALGLPAQPSQPAAGAAAAPPQPFLGVEWAKANASLGRYDATTFAALAGRRVPLGRYTGAWAVSPDGRRLALGSGSVLGVRFVDVRAMRRAFDVKTRHGAPVLLAWLAPRRLVGVERSWVFAVDPVARKVLRHHSIGGYLHSSVRVGDSLVLLLSSAYGIAAPELVVVDAAGRARSVRVEGIRSGSSFPREGDAPEVGEAWQPGLAADPEGRRAFVVGGEGVVAEVDLATLRVSTHPLRERVSFLTRLREWWEPAAQAKGPVVGRSRRAQWLGDGLIAVAGEDGVPVLRPDGRETARADPYGVRVIDVRDWTVRTVDARARSFAVAGATILAYGADWSLDAREYGGSGLTGYTTTGDRRFELFGDAPLAVSVHRGLAYVQRLDVGGTTVVDPASGAVVAVLDRPLPQLVAE